MRRFSREYLRDTRRGLWDDRGALAALELASRTRILDVGAGSGEFTRILREESPGTVIAVDADLDLLREAPTASRVGAEATRLPFDTDAFDLVVCQALLVNLPDPIPAIEEFGRVSRDLVAAVEPDNSQVTVSSTVPSEGQLSRRARSYYMAGLETDASLGSEVPDLFRQVGLADVRVDRSAPQRTVSPPYSDSALESAKRKVTGTRLAKHRQTMLRGGLTPAEFDSLRDQWQEMGRAVVSQMTSESYRRQATVPFYVTVGRTM